MNQTEIMKLAYRIAPSYNILKYAEESGELIHALREWVDTLGSTDPETVNKVIEELADVLIMTEIIKVLCMIPDEALEVEIERKMRRNMERIND